MIFFFLNIYNMSIFTYAFYIIIYVNVFLEGNKRNKMLRSVCEL